MANRCEMCGAEFQGPDELARHNQEAHGQANVPRCQACGEQFQSREELDRHNREYHPA